MTTSRPTLRILGIRGIPAAHGGFETFAERLAPYLVSRGWRVIVYCQQLGRGEATSDTWEGIERVHIPVPRDGALGTMHFDLLSTLHARRSPGLCLTLGYNTAFLWPLLRTRGVLNVANMDGIEWRRGKWSRPVKAWFWLNDWFGCWTAHHLVADHPEIRKLLMTRVREDKITQIAYGADRIRDVPPDALAPLGLESGRFMTLIARAEPENSVLECVQGFSRRRRGIKLAVLGKYAEDNEYHRRVKACAGDEVVFVGPLYDKASVQALRAHCMAYLHGHQVGGTNPSLVEALGSGNPVIAHDNVFNRWVTDERAAYFTNADEADDVITRVVQDPVLRTQLSRDAVSVFESRFAWEKILGSYEATLHGVLQGAVDLPETGHGVGPDVLHDHGGWAAPVTTDAEAPIKPS